MKEISRAIELIICPNCNGKGYIVKRMRSCPYDSDYTNVECCICDGKRVVNKITTIEYDQVL